MANLPVTRRVTQIGGSRVARTGEADDFRQPTKKRQLASDSPTIPINTDRLSFETKQSVGQEYLGAKHKERDTRSYHIFMELGQAGPAKIARDQDHVLVVLKAIKTSETDTTQNLRFFKADKVISLLDCYQSCNERYLVYELLSVSLRQIQGTSRGRQIQSYEIAAICKEVWLSPAIQETTD